MSSFDWTQIPTNKKWIKKTRKLLRKDSSIEVWIDSKGKNGDSITGIHSNFVKSQFEDISEITGINIEIVAKRKSADIEIFSQKDYKGTGFKYLKKGSRFSLNFHSNFSNFDEFDKVIVTSGLLHPFGLKDIPMKDDYWVMSSTSVMGCCLSTYEGITPLDTLALQNIWL
tara:strand:+ start:142 stop:651 length:510 start_codon:yes stop_codon:yes gene_type:complete